jgi:hypothetical protein
MGSHDLRLLGITTHSESVQPLQTVKLVYQPYSRSRAVLDPYGIEITINLLVLAIHYSLYMIMCLYWEHYLFVATQLLKTWSTKSYMQLNQCLSYLSFMNPMLYLLSTFVLTLAFPTPQDGLPIVKIVTTTSTSLKNTRLVVNQLTCLCHRASYHKIYLCFRLVKWRLYDFIRYVINICDDTIYICHLMCDRSLDAHKIMHSICSLKMGVIDWYQSHVDCRTQA